jgi:hypothetical protein
MVPTTSSSTLPPSPFDPELDAIDTMHIGEVIQYLVRKNDDAYVIAAGLIFRERAKTMIKMERARALIVASESNGKG